MASARRGRRSGPVVGGRLTVRRGRDDWLVLVLADAVSTATLVLAGVTFALVLVTVGLGVVTYGGNQGARVAEAHQLEASQRQLAASYLPVIVPYQRNAENLSYRGGTIPVNGGPYIVGNRPEGTDVPRYSSAMVAVENVGVGPALNLRGRYEGPQGSGSVQVPLEAIAVGTPGVLTFENREGASLDYTSRDQVSMVIVYNDVAGHEYSRRITYNSMERAYTESRFEGRPEWHS